jgi:signal transduction histidine kinase
VFPQAVGTPTYEHHLIAARDRLSITYEALSPVVGYWIEVTVYPGNGGGLAVYFHDISARKQAEAEKQAALEQAERARREAQDALRLREQVLAAVSHDLKGPLTAIRCTAQVAERMLAKMDMADSDSLKRDMERIQEASVRMRDSIDELMDVAQLEAGQQLHLRRSPTDLLALVTDAIVEARLEAPQHEVRLDLPELSVIGLWDAARLRRVIDNLLSNAFKYSPDGTPVEVQVTTEPRNGADWVSLMVRDYGVGISAEDQSHLFEHLWRGQTTREQMPGSGVGLAGAQRIVQQHGGHVEVVSSRGEGSTFTVRLPLSG